MIDELERIGNYYCVGFHIFEHPVLDSSHLFGKEIDVDVIIGVDICQKKIFFQEPEIRISKDPIQDFSQEVREILDLISIAIYAEGPVEEPHRFAVAASQIHHFFSTSELQVILHELDMLIERWNIHRQRIPAEKKNEQSVDHPHGKKYD